MTRPAYPPRRSNHVGPGQVPRPVVALDIDGTLGVYHGHFLNFAEAYLGREMPPTLEYTGGPLHRFMGVSKDTYRKVKLAYRQGGMKRSMPAYPGAAELSRGLRQQGAEVWICTTRPYLRLDNIDPDTRHWLSRVGVQFDGVIFGENKYRDLARLVDRRRVVGVLDDLPEMYRQAAALGLHPIVRDQPYNHGLMFVDRVSNLHAAQAVLTGRLRYYEKEVGNDN